MDREIEQLKALVSNLESRKRQQHQNNNSQEQILLEERDRENDFGETSLLSNEVNRAIIDIVESKRQEKDGGPNQTQIVAEIQKRHATTMTGTSRESILKRIESLVQFRVIIERRDAKYNQKRYYVNKENLLLKTQRFFDEFESALINLVKTFMESRAAPIDFQTSEEALFFLVIFKLYHHVTNIAVTEATLEWPKITNDTVLLNMAYRALFAKLVKLQENFSKVLDEAGLQVRGLFYNDSWIITPEDIRDGAIVQHKLKLPREHVRLLFNLAWSISTPYLRFALTKLGEPDDPDIVDRWSSAGGWEDVFRYWLNQELKKEQHQK